jgi:hypothetical protein
VPGPPRPRTLDLTHLLVAGGKEYWDASCTSSADLGPHWLRVRTDAYGRGPGTNGRHRVQRSHKSLTLSSCSCDDAEGRFGLWSRRSWVRRRAADGQQPIVIATNRTAGEA